MGMAVLRGALAAGALRAADTLVVEASAERRAEAAALGARTSADPAEAAEARALLLAVKPQHFEHVAPALRAAPLRLVVSVMAGWSIATLGRMLGGARVVRAMPNLPAQIGLGVTALAAGGDMPAAMLAEVERLFGCVGRTLRVREEDLDAVTAVSGSGPAYLFLLAEAEIAAAIGMGLDPDAARALVTETLLGAATMLARGPHAAGDLRAAVTSRGGTTEAAVRVLEDARFREGIARALAAARDRAAELGR
jgi:pyrroline-5-carboxylate reductase